jgi:hypothetical protein
MTALNLGNYGPQHPVTLAAANVTNLTTQLAAQGASTTFGKDTQQRLRQAQVELVDVLMAAGRLDPSLIISNTAQ